NGRLRSTEALQLDKVFTVGTGCAPNGLIGRDAVGATLSCQSGVWKNGMNTNVFISGYGTQSLGVHSYCALMGTTYSVNMGAGKTSGYCRVTKNSNGSWNLSDSEKPGTCNAICF
ncbi:shufflon system plasmid conjugative transfer pilus tip adhesin PilV, partial [Yersinia ruckeri]